MSLQRHDCLFCYFPTFKECFSFSNEKSYMIITENFENAEILNETKITSRIAPPKNII